MCVCGGGVALKVALPERLGGGVSLRWQRRETGGGGGGGCIEGGRRKDVGGGGGA